MRTEPVRRWRSLVLTAAAAATLFTAASCSDDGDGDAADETPTTETSEFCAAVEELGDSLAALTDVDVTRDGTDELRAALDTVTDDIEAIPDATGDGSDESDAAIEEVRTAFDALKEAVTEAGDAPSAGDAVEAIGAAVIDLAEAAGALTETLLPECGEAG
jgi:hypothetical protein